MKSSAELVQEQIDAYNARDLEAFLKTYAELVVLFKDGQELMHGKAVLRERYGRLFRENPSLHCDIRSRQIVGDVITDEEYVTGLADGKHLHVRARYEIETERICRVSLTTLPD